MRRLVIAMGLLGAFAGPALAGDKASSFELGVDGLSCPFCVYGIEKELASIDGVETMDVDIENGVLVVHVRPGATLDEGAARRATEDAGFTLRSFEQVLTQ